MENPEGDFEAIGQGPPMSYNEMVFSLIADLRGLPERCDFCAQRYGLCIQYEPPFAVTQRATPRRHNPARTLLIQQHIEYQRGWPCWITVRYPIPEEAGEWTCNECLARWRAEGVPGYA